MELTKLLKDIDNTVNMNIAFMKKGKEIIIINRYKFLDLVTNLVNNGEIDLAIKLNSLIINENTWSVGLDKDMKIKLFINEEFFNEQEINKINNSKERKILF